MSTVHPPEDAAAPPIGEQSAPPCAPPTTEADATNATDPAPAKAEAASPAPPPTRPSGAITVFKALRDPEGTRKQVIWPSLFAVFQQPMVSDSKSTVPGYATCTFTLGSKPSPSPLLPAGRRALSGSVGERVRSRKSERAG